MVYYIQDSTKVDHTTALIHQWLLEFAKGMVVIVIDFLISSSRICGR